MSFLGLMLRAGLRHRWRSWLALSLLAAVVIGVVLAGAQTARRTATAFPRYEAAHGFDAFFYGVAPVPHVASLPGVSSVIPVTETGGGTPSCSPSCRPINNNYFSINEVPARSLSEVVKLVGGRMPVQSNPSEVLASENLTPYGVHIGTVLRVPLAATSQRAAVLNGANITPTGPVVTLHVVGLSLSEQEFPTSTSPVYDVYTTDRFAQEYNPRTVVFYEYYFRLRGGGASLPQFLATVRAHGGLSGTDFSSLAGEIETSIDPQAVGWSILTGLAGLVGLIVLAQALARQAALEAEDSPTLGALGATRRQVFGFSVARTVAVAVAGAFGGVALAASLSVFTPVGEARMADPNPGFDFDTLLLVGGAAVAVVVVVLLGLWPALRSSRMTSSRDERPAMRPSRVVAFLSASGAPPSALIGVRNALERGRGRTAVPVGSAFIGAVLAVTVLCGTAVFGASLAHLTDTPSQYGQAFDAWFNVNGTGTVAQGEQLLRDVERPGITSITAGIGGAVSINGKTVNAVAGQSLRGPLVIPLTNGRYPADDDEVVLGGKTMRSVGARPGSTVRVAFATSGGPSNARTFRVVGTVVFPPDFNSQGLGTGALFSIGALSGNSCDNGADRTCLVSSLVETSGVLIVRAAPDAPGRAALAALSRNESSAVNYPQPPTDLVNFGQAVNFPLIFGLIVVLFGIGTLLHLLLISVSRRRREMGLLKAIGFVRRQIVWSVSWQTTTVAVVGILIGVPLGVAAGRAIWSAFAINLGVPAEPVVTSSAIVLLALGTVAVANLLAVVPAVVASRSRPASLLRVE